MKTTYQPGDKIAFAEEARPYTVQAAGQRYLVCTKPLNIHRTVLYTIVDLAEQVRGPEHLVFGAGAETRQQCEEMLARIEAGKTEISRRNQVPLKLRAATGA